MAPIASSATLVRLGHDGHQFGQSVAVDEIAKHLHQGGQRVSWLGLCRELLPAISRSAARNRVEVEERNAAFSTTGRPPTDSLR